MTKQIPLGRRRLASVVLGTLATCLVLLTGASSAWAGVGLGVTPNIPVPNGPVTVGQSYNASLRIINISDLSQGDDQIRLSAITLVPSCGVIASVNCPNSGFGGNPLVTAYDPDVFALSATGTGRANTACDGRTFNITNVDPAQDKYEFVPVLPTAAQIVLGPADNGGLAAQCIIDFTVNVLKVPTKDARPEDGVQTNELGGANGVSVQDGQTGQGTGTNNTTVNLAPPNLTTQVSFATRTLGQSFSDTATLSFTAGAATPTGTVTFRLFGPNDANCTGAVIFTAANVPLNASAQATAGPFTPTQAGTYRWIASYSGDANYLPDPGSCNQPNESVLVNPATPGITTQVSNTTRTVGQPFSDTATLTFPAGAATPTGTVVFRIYGPTDTNCVNTPIFTSAAVTLDANAMATSPPFTPQSPGIYRYIATYGGDANYTTVAGTCVDANEQVTVTQQTPGITTQVSNATRTVGQPFTDQATVTFLPAGPTPTGTVIFRLYGPTDTNCANTPISTSAAIPLNGSAVATSPSFTPQAPGTYRYIATYSGDANYTTIAGTCIDANEQVTVTQQTPGITTQVSNANRTVGQPFSDTATVTFLPAGPTPTGTVVFRLYGPTDTNCANTPIFTSAAITIDGAAMATAPPFTPQSPGTYRYIATYSGDANYTTIAGTCIDANEQVTVTQQTPGITTQVSNANRTVGQPFTDQATVTFLPAGPTPTGTVIFRLYGPTDTNCANTPISTSAAIPLNGSAVATSPSFTPQAPGTYRYIATYSGDANYTTVAGTCIDANEQVTVTQQTPGITTQVSNANRTVGQPFSDTATVTFLPAGPTPTGTVVFRLYGPTDTNCANTPIFTSAAITLDGAAMATAPPFTPQSPGTYRYIATYSGDANYTTIAGTCVDANEQVTVTQQTPGITTQVSNANRTVGQPFTDQATVTFLPAGPTPTGTVIFRLYGPTDTNCANTPISTSAAIPLNGSAVATSPSFTPQAPGTYRYIATYSGDANYTTIAGTCVDANEQVTVIQQTPGITTQVSSSTRTVGQAFTDTANVTFLPAGPTPTGTVTFRVYGPTDPGCANLPIFTSLNQPLNGSAAAVSESFIPQAPGTYRVIATYSGDANYTTIAGTCIDANEQVVVSQATPGITTQVSSATRTVGQPVTDQATVTFPATGPTPTGTVIFRIYGPTDANCANTPLVTSAPIALNGSAVATSPTFIPQAPGTYRYIATYSGDANYTSIAGTCIDANEQVVVSQQTPGIVTQVSSAARTVGQPFTDTATVTFLPAGPTPTGTVTFRIYGPTDGGCTNAPIFTSSAVAIDGAAMATSPSFTPQSPGTYRVIATYSGDGNYTTIAGTCADANEQVVVSQQTPGIVTQVSNATRTVGQPFTDQATVTFLPAGPTPTGTVIFRLYGPTDPGCANTPISTSAAIPLNGSAVATSPAFTPQAPGTYRYIATYSGDANYTTIAGTCVDANEQVVVTQAAPGITTQVSSSTRTVGQSFTDQATVTFPAGGPTPTGNVTFRVYGPTDAGCANAPIFTSSNQPLNGSAIATSESFVPQAPGTYRVIATYNGDSNYTLVAGTCIDANEQVVVSPATPGITTQVSNATRTVGQPFSDQATVTFPATGPTPTGTVIFRLYGPTDAGCANTPISTSAPIALNGSAIATSPTFTPQAPGTYRYIATYSGDANYTTIAGTCIDANEQVVVSPAQPGITTQVSNATRTVGQSFTDTATVSFPAAGPTPTGNVTFRIYAPTDAGCLNAAIFTSPARPLDGAAMATSAAFTPQSPGTYRVIATYNGDSNYMSIAGTCVDANEQVVVSPAQPGITTQVSNPTRTVGQSFTDQATVTFPAAGPTPTGDVTFRIYAPSDPNCAAAPIFTSAARPLNGSAIATSAAFTPQSPGTYRVIATYNGDGNYSSVAGTCIDANEQVVVSPAQPGITTQVSNATRTVGQSFTDQATVTFPAGGPTPTGDVTFRVYGPNDGGCTTAPIFTSASRPLDANAVATSAPFTPLAPGMYRVIATYNGDGNYSTIAGACGDANEQVNVAPAQPGIVTQVSAATRTVGQSFTDEATVTFPAGGPTPTGDVTFRVYGPTDPNCTSAPIFTSSARPLNGSAVATSASFTPLSPGTYRVIATYNGDGNYATIAGQCGDLGEQVVVSQATPGIQTQVSDATRTIGQSFTDQATVTFPAAGPTPTGNVTFRIYAPSDPNCAAAPIFTSASRPLNGSAVATSAPFTPQSPGTYHVIATYTGDTNYNSIAGACGDTGEQVVVSPATPGITTQVSNPTRTVGQSFTDQATVTFPASGPTPTGTVTFRVYGPTDATCAAAPIFTSASRPLNGSAVATSEAFTPVTPGTYRVIATYNGDGNYNEVAGLCSDANEQVVVGLAAPTIATDSSNDIVLGAGQIIDQATVSGRVSPLDTATIDFRLYDNATCSGTPVFQTLDVPYPASATTVSSEPFTPTHAGTYRWIASYSGDANNLGVSGACNDPNENTVVARNTPTITTNATDTVVLGATVIDNATVSGRVSPVDGATITFRLYGPNNATCAGNPVYTSPPIPYPAGGGSVASPEFTPTEAGSYRWIATYSGDANNVGVAGACNDANELTTVTTPATPPPPPVVPPPPPPPVVVPPPPPPPAQEVAPVSDVPRGSATISGKTGCQGTPFNVMVSGRQIEKVIFSLDGKIIKTLTRPNSGSRYKLPVNPRTKKIGIHRVLARIVFTEASGTNNRTLRVLFTRCGRKTNLPAFTG